MQFNDFIALYLPSLKKTTRKKGKIFYKKSKQIGKALEKEKERVFFLSESMSSMTKKEGSLGGEKPTKRNLVFMKVDQLKPGTKSHTLATKVLSSDTILQK